jgi:hypothetical protein
VATPQWRMAVRCCAEHLTIPAPTVFTFCQEPDSNRLALFALALEGSEQLLAGGQLVSRVASSSIIEQMKCR